VSEDTDVAREEVSFVAGWKPGTSCWNLMPLSALEYLTLMEFEAAYYGQESQCIVGMARESMRHYETVPAYQRPRKCRAK